MSTITKTDSKPFINVTPLIDVLLVLLIIFMVAVPLKPTRFEAKLPSEPDDSPKMDPNIWTLVVTIEPDRSLKLNSLTNMGTVDDTSKLSLALRNLFEERKKNHAYRYEMLFRSDLPDDARIEKTVFIKGRYFNSFNGTAGSLPTPAFTFVDGDCVLDGGAGLLIVTGNLELNGNPSFDGLILVLGEGTINRDGGGNGNIYGSIVVARFELNGTMASLHRLSLRKAGEQPKIQYDSTAVRRALNISGPLALGVREF